MPYEEANIQAMFQPIRCAFCNRIYDLGKVEITGRYTDCSVWKTPCCGVTADSRGETGWKSRQDYIRIDKNRPEAMDIYGRLVWPDGIEG